MTKHDDGGVAFPTAPVRVYGGRMDPDCYSGMSLLDWFAGQALGAFCAHVDRDAKIPELAEWAYKVATAMLAEKRRREQQEQDDDEA